MSDDESKEVSVLSLIKGLFVRTNRLITLFLRRILGLMIEMEDVHFHHNSALMLPEGTTDAQSSSGGEQRYELVGLNVIATVFQMIRNYPDKRLVIAGHTDRSGPDMYNFELSRLRANAVLSIVIGDPDLWVISVRDRKKVKDIQAICKHMFNEFSWDCDPGEIDDIKGERTNRAIRNFKAQYNIEFSQSIPINSTIDEPLLRAIFDVYEWELANFLGETHVGGLSTWRARVRFVEDSNPVVACGESFSLEFPNIDGRRSATDRRVEFLFFDRHECPVIICPPPRTSPHKKPECPLYNPDFVDLRYIDGVPEGLTLTITSPGIDNARRTSHGAAVAVNNDWDNGQTYGAAPAAGHREGEPILDFNHLDTTANEDDLLEVTIDLQPAGLNGNVTLQATEGANRIRLWPASTKGAAGDVISLPATFPTSDLPRQIFVEGLDNPGRCVLETSYVHDASNVSDRLVVNVVDLRESQAPGTTRKIVYDYNSPIAFEVRGAPANYSFEWDFDGDGSFNSAPFESGKTSSSESCAYGPVQNANTVQLVQNAANRRQMYDVAVRMTGGLILHVKGMTLANDGVTWQNGIRVALGTNQGQPLPAQSTAGLHTLYNWNDNSPVNFDPTDAAHSGANRISYDAADPNNASTLFSAGLGAARRVLYVTVGPAIFTSGQRREDLNGTVNHEIVHLRQHVAVRDNSPANNIWRRLDNHYGSTNGYRDFREVEGHFSEILDTDISWRHHLPAVQRDLAQFVTRYNRCRNLIAAIPAGAMRNAARSFLMDIYNRIPFFEMKRAGYDHSVLPPP